MMFLFPEFFYVYLFLNYVILILRQNTLYTMPPQTLPPPPRHNPSGELAWPNLPPSRQKPTAPLPKPRSPPPKLRSPPRQNASPLKNPSDKLPPD